MTNIYNMKKVEFFMNNKLLNILTIFLIIVGLIVPVSSFSGLGAGTSGDPFQITTCALLQEMNLCYGCDYKLMNDVDCDINPFNINNGFLPIGSTSGTDFTGTLNGSGYEIQNLFIDRSTTEEVGLFGATNTPGKISNVSLVNVQVTGQHIVGGLVGYNYFATIENSYSSGNVVGTNYVGGLVGYNYYATIDNSYSSGTVVGDFGVGGLVGRNFGTISHINNSYSSADVNGSGAVGGLGGLIYGDVDNSYATGNVIATSQDIGGLIGFCGSVVINNSYSVGDVIGDTHVGGICGFLSGGSSEIINSFTTSGVQGNTVKGGLVGDYALGTISNTFWNNDSSNPSNIFGSSSTGGVTTIADDVSRFYNELNEPLASWDPLRWEFSGSSFPMLVWEGVGGEEEEEVVITPPAESSSSSPVTVLPFSNSFWACLVIILTFFIFG